MADSQLVHLVRREYVLNCNWKVFCDNYLVRSGGVALQDTAWQVSLPVHLHIACAYVVLQQQLLLPSRQQYYRQVCSSYACSNFMLLTYTNR